INQIDEQCDLNDGVTAGHTCDNTCHLVTVVTPNPPTPPTPPTPPGGGGGPICGDSHTESYEQCDDGNTVDGDGCSSVCKWETTTPTSTTGTIAPILLITKISDLDTAIPGDIITYTVTVNNTGDDTATNVEVGDVLPDGFIFTDNSTTSHTWSLGDLATDESKTVTYTVKVADDIEAGTYKNGAVAKADNHPLVYANKEIQVVIPQIAGSEYQELPDTGGQATWFEKFLYQLTKLGNDIKSLVLGSSADQTFAQKKTESLENSNQQPAPTRVVEKVDGPNRLVIDKIDVEIPIVEGKNEKQSLLAGAWHMPNTADPNEIGNMVIAGHRYYKKPPAKDTFFNLDKLNIGDNFKIVWNGDLVDYKITEIKTVSPTQTEVLDESNEKKVTLITCTPLYSSQKRLIVIGQPTDQADSLVATIN
ncbi:MAG: sortase, partial [Candidatus Buchananbacteria bacterium]|nr:sortase [Candidatus Buchananbacteria bacterium]